MACRHPDIRRFDGVRCCLACGEAVFERQQLVPSPQPRPSLAPSRYEYDDLNFGLGQQIRLVAVLPGEDSDPVRCEILHVYLDDSPIFEAISYSWALENGDDSKSRMIQLENGAVVHVSVNCEAALRQLRSSSEKRLLWIDAICINQTNVSERNHQVGLMDRIFSSAQKVIMFIQYLPPDTSGLNTELDTLFAWLQTRGPHASFYSEYKKGIDETLQKILRLRYFRRVWIIQEVALAKRLHLRINSKETELYYPILERIRKGRNVPPALL